MGRSWVAGVVAALLAAVSLLAPGVPVDRVAAADASLPPTAVPSASPAPPSPSPSPRPGPAGFIDRVSAYAEAVYPVFSAFRAALGSGDQHGDAELVGRLATASDDLLRWLDSNPPALCYSESWVAFHAAAQQLGPMFGRYVLVGLDAITDQLIMAGTALQSAAATIPRAALSCGVVIASPSPNAGPESRFV